MLEHLFGSKTRLRLLRLFFQHPETAFYVREMARSIKSQMNAVRRELMNLEQAGVIEVTKPDAQQEEDRKLARCTWYRLREESMFYDELRSLILKSRVVGEKTFTEELVKAFPRLDTLLLTGQFVHNEAAPIDMLIVGDVDTKKLSRIMHKYESENGRPVRYTIFTSREFRERQQIVDKFLFSIYQAPHVIVVGGSIIA